MRIEIQVLGGFQVAVGGAAIPADAWKRERGAALVKLLAVSPAHRLHREQVMEAFWPDLDPEAAGANLRKAVHFARKSLGVAELIDFNNDIVALAPNDELVIDAESFAASAKTVLRDPARESCERAAEQYRGELLPDDRYLDWLEQPRQELRSLYARLLKAGQLWERLVQLDPGDEEASCAVMQSALDAGDRGEVVRIFQRLRERLRIDLGVGPSAKTVALYERALATSSVSPDSVADRVRASLAWGLIQLHSGDFKKADQIGRETRELALGAELAREVGEASALIGMVAHMQGGWRELFRSEFIEWVRAARPFASHFFDGNLCLAEFSLAAASGHDDMAKQASELLQVAEQANSVAGRAIATLILGQAELFSGRLDESERLLTQAEQLHVEAEAPGGRVLAIQRLAEIALARGQKYLARRMIERALRPAKASWLKPHLQIRLSALLVQTSANPQQVEEAVLEGDRRLTKDTTCQPCSMGYRAAAAIALAESGELDQVGRRLDEADRLAGMWNGGPWVAALWEARGVLRRAQGSEDRARAAFSEAVARFVDLGRPIDQARCTARMS